MCSTSIDGWNPAVENQATDRAFRIGQTKNVQVHKFICEGTLEKKIDEMIENKKALAENIIGIGEGWLTEMSTKQLKEMFTLRREAVADEFWDSKDDFNKMMSRFYEDVSRHAVDTAYGEKTDRKKVGKRKSYYYHNNY